jgi:hypothetical protein
MRHAIKRKQSRRHAHVIGVDSETLQGPPISFQFYSEHVKGVNDCVFIGKQTAISVFLRYLSRLPPGNYRMYGHNLEFDMLSFLWEQRAKFRDGNIDLRIGAWTITGRFSKPIFCNFTDGKRNIEVVDSFLWFMTSLEKAGALVCPDLPKLKRIAGLGEKLFTAKDTAFVEYALRDAVVAFHLGVAIEGFHEEMEIPSQISLASMASSIFQRKFMLDNIYQPPLYEWMVGAAASYHGGVNRVKEGAAPAWHENVSALDLSSAYPHAMTFLPDLSDPNGYRKFKTKGKRVSSVPNLGIYKVSGTFAKCHWPALFDHNFKPLRGKFTDTWVTGWELNAAIEHDEVTIRKLDGYTYDKTSPYSPFKAYAEEFYRLKETAKDPITRYMYKIVLNGVTGKFIQTSPDYTLADGQLVKINRAGGLYHPFCASLITGHTRARIHEAEHKYSALHTATDGIFVPGKVQGAKKKELGALVSEGFGSLALLRNKLYIFYSDDDEGGKATPSQAFKGRFVLKCARHGFQGTVGDLEAMLTSKQRKYKINKPMKLKTAIKQKGVPNKFVTTQRTLNVATTFKRFIHKR